jgi:hypothetical protein
MKSLEDALKREADNIGRTSKLPGLETPPNEKLVEEEWQVLLRKKQE